MFEWLDDPKECAKMGITAEMLSNLQVLRTEMPKVPLTTNPNAIAVGFSPLKAILPTVPKVEHGQMTLAEKVRRDNALCEGCTGTCRKEPIDRYWVQVLRELHGDEVVCVKRCKFGRQKSIERLIRSSQIPARYVGKTLADYSVDNLNRTAVEYAKNALKLKIGAYFYGNCGAGKTFLASIIAQNFLQAEKSVVFVKVPNLLDDIRATFNGNGREVDILRELEAADLVVLDDFGMEKPTQFSGATLCKVLDTRYDTRKLTIITSNLSPEMLADKLDNASDGQNLNGSRIFDRLREICKPILLKGVSRRN